MPSSEKFTGDELKKLSQHLPDLIFQFTRRPDGRYYVPVASKGIENIFGCTPEDVKENFDAIANVLNLVLELGVCILGRPIQWILSKS
jgi:hypothetical protein